MASARICIPTHFSPGIETDHAKNFVINNDHGHGCLKSQPFWKILNREGFVRDSFDT